MIEFEKWYAQRVKNRLPFNLILMCICNRRFSVSATIEWNLYLFSRKIKSIRVYVKNSISIDIKLIRTCGDVKSDKKKFSHFFFFKKKQFGRNIYVWPCLFVYLLRWCNAKWKKRWNVVRVVQRSDFTFMNKWIIGLNRNLYLYL